MKPQDIVVLAQILLKRECKWTYQQISTELGISQSECHAAIKRSLESGLFNGLKKRVNRAAFKEFLIYGLKYIYPAKIGKLTRGVLTAHAVGPLNNNIIKVENDVYVWPHAKGSAKGQSLKPLYPSVPQVALSNEQFYIFMVLIDLIRIGQTRERNSAVKSLEKILKEDF